MGSTSKNLWNHTVDSPLENVMRPALVMNMFYTGLGIARSLGEHGVPVVGLTSQRGVFGNYTRHAKTVLCPDSRHAPEALLQRLLELGRRMDQRSVIFPTRDDDVVFLDRFRKELEPYFIVTVPESSVLQACLNKWETFLWAERVGIPTPKCWLIEGEKDLARVLPDVTYPCVLKPVAAHHWRKARNWALVGGRKAIGVSSQPELLAEYRAIARADQRALLQEMVPGPDDSLLIAACYLDRESNFVAGFNTQKLLQTPEGFGTGCIVQTADRPELFERSARLLKAMNYTGIAEVEYKWDARKRDYQLIEINPRPWDQHPLGKACGVDLIYLAYCDHAGLPMPRTERQTCMRKWVAEDAFLLEAFRLLWNRDGASFFRLFRLARGNRIYSIWSWHDPLPSLGYMPFRFIPGLIGTGLRSMWSGFRRMTSSKPRQEDKNMVYEQHLENENSRS